MARLVVRLLSPRHNSILKTVRLSRRPASRRAWSLPRSDHRQDRPPMFPWRVWTVCLLGLAATCLAEDPPNRAAFQKFVESHCLDCHDKSTKESGLALDELLGAADVGQHAEAWEKVVRKLTARHMPPMGSPRPS